MWPFKKKRNDLSLPEPGAQALVLALEGGKVTQATHGYVEIDGRRQAVSKPLVFVGQSVIKNQPIGKP